MRLAKRIAKLGEISIAREVAIRLASLEALAGVWVASGLKDQTYQLSSKSPLVTPKSEARSEISVKFGIYEGKVENFRVRCLPPLYIYVGEVSSGR